MTVLAYFIGGAMDGEVRALPDPLPDLMVPGDFDIDRGWRALRYIRRPLHLVPASFARRHGPEAQIYDWELRPRVARRAYAQLILPPGLLQLQPAGFLSAICFMGSIIMRELAEHGAYDPRDLEWRVHENFLQAEHLMRAEVVMEVDRFEVRG